MKQKAKSTKKVITKDEAEKILKQSQNQSNDIITKNKDENKPSTKKAEAKKSVSSKVKSKTLEKKRKKVSKK